jgi:hypothetical protein
MKASLPILALFAVAGVHADAQKFQAVTTDLATGEMSASAPQAPDSTRQPPALPALLDAYERMSHRVPRRDSLWTPRRTCIHATAARTDDELVAVLQKSHEAAIADQHEEGVELLSVLEPSRRTQFLEFLRAQDSTTFYDPDYREIVRRGGSENIRKQLCAPRD